MADWWTELESEILNCLEPPVELARGDSDALETNAAPPRRGLA